jgi:type 1 glutamine amidotransferase
MKTIYAAMLVGSAVVAGFLCAQTPPGSQAHPKRVLFIGASKGFQHDSISYAAGTIWKLGHDSGLWDTYIRTDTQLITKKKLTVNARNLDYFDAVYFYCSADLDLDAEQKASLLAFVHDDGKGFIGGHTVTDCNQHWPEWVDMVGGIFINHPWHQAATVNVEDRSFPATAHFGPKLQITDEFYENKEFSRDRVRVLMSLDTTSVDMTKPTIERKDGDFALTWVRNYGKGRVFCSALGHEDQVYDRPDMQKMYLEAVKWVLGMTNGDATPRQVGVPLQKPR